MQAILDKREEEKEHQSDTLSLVQYVTAAPQVQQHNSIIVRNMRGKKRLKDRAENFHFAHSPLLVLVFTICQAGKVHPNLDLTKVKCDNNKLSIVQKEYVKACVSPNNMND